MTIAVGELAPDFTLKNQHGQEVSLSGLRGKPVAVVFFPFAFTGICTGELCEIRDNLSVFTEQGAVVVAISCDPVFSNRVFSDQEGYTFDILSDFWPHGAVSQAYGVFEPGPGAARRATFLIDADGIVRWTVNNPLGEARDFAGYKEALAALN
ncbi:MAG TPA: peroxiredoxin [Aeromicrobium sp.]|jgi:peroxiredoxin|nr:peroxiredoxin [Aeromicrobium sp.]HKY58617.1 peroxiredoxin [Aeromicrobium sp.]